MSDADKRNKYSSATGTTEHYFVNTRIMTGVKGSTTNSIGAEVQITLAMQIRMQLLIHLATLPEWHRFSSSLLG